MGTPSLDGSQGKGRRILPSLRRISTTPLKPRRRSSSSSSESSCPSPPPAPKQPARPSPLRSAAVAAARKTRRFFGAKSNDILPGIFSFFLAVRTDLDVVAVVFVLFHFFVVVLSVVY
jgi:hypothetical protein